jgi:hypothetical protein
VQRIVAVASSLVAVLTLAGAAAPRPAIYYTNESWFDAQHGWRVNVGTVESSEDGGLTWHSILRRRGASKAVRTSRTTGVVALARRVLWTRDNGRHWRTLRAGTDLQGQNHWLFYVGGRTRRSLFQVTPWPPQNRTRSTKVAELPQGESFSALETIPGGIAAAINLLNGKHPRVPKVLIRRFGRNRVISVPLPPEWPNGSCYLSGFRVKWPAITVLAQVYEGYGSCDSSISTAIIWFSPDGGDTWTIGAPTQRNAGRG